VQRLLVSIPVAVVGEDPEGVHDARVATRRLRSDLRTFEGLLEAEWAASLRSDLVGLAGALGAVRDADVMAGRLGALLDRHPEIDQSAGSRVLQALEVRRSEARTHLLDRLDDDETRDLVARLIEAGDDPRTLPAATGPVLLLLPPVQRRWRRLRRAVAGLSDPPSIDELHRVRILAKRLRYAAEAVTPAYGREARRCAAAAARLQDVLGELNDAAVTHAWLAATSALLDGPAAFAAGQMSRQLGIDAVGHLDEWEADYRRVRRRTTAWLDGDTGTG
jgi:CHAD domain-containing protein